MTIEVRTEKGLSSRTIEQIVVRGNTSGLNAQEKTEYYLYLCESLDLNPATQPIEFISFQGREIAYVKRGGTDQMAAKNLLNREVIEGPEVRKIGNQDVAYCKVLVTHPNGRREMEVATLPVKDVTMDLMKVITKAKRRGTLSILGLGMLDESEVEDMVSALPAPMPATAIVTQTRQRDVASGLQPPQAVIDDVASLGGKPTVDEAAAIFVDHAPGLGTEDKHAMFEYLLARSGTRSSELQRTIAEEQWASDVRSATSVDELKAIYTAACKETETNKGLWGKAAGPAAIADLKELCGAKRRKIEAAVEPIDDDPERDAIESEPGPIHAPAPAAPLTASVTETPEQVLRGKLGEIAVVPHLFNAFFKYRAGIPSDVAVQICADRLLALGYTKDAMSALNRVRDEIKSRGGK